MKNLKYQLKKFLKRFFLIDDSAHKVAAGAALGIFVGTIPGGGVIAAMLLAAFFRFNRLAATFGALATNMWLTILLMPPAAIIGGALFGIDHQKLIADFENSYKIGWKQFFSVHIFSDLVLPLVVGFVLIAAIISLFTYSLLHYLLENKKIKFK